MARVAKNLPANAADISDTGSIPGSGGSPGGGHGNPHQHSCLENPKDRGAWRAIASSRVRHAHMQTSIKISFLLALEILVSPQILAVLRVRMQAAASLQGLGRPRALEDVPLLRSVQRSGPGAVALSQGLHRTVA